MLSLKLLLVMCAVIQCLRAKVGKMNSNSTVTCIRLIVTFRSSWIAHPMGLVVNTGNRCQEFRILDTCFYLSSSKSAYSCFRWDLNLISSI